MPDQLKVGVAGAGVFGRFHAQKFSAISGVTLTSVFDADLERANDLAIIHDAMAFDDFDKFLETIDLLSIATPATTHFNYGLRAAKVGRHAYIEKPLAIEPNDAGILIEEFSVRNLTLFVGHQERHLLHNLGVFSDARVHSAEFSRCGSGSGRGTDVSVVYDLMIHDLDFACQLGFKNALKYDVCGDFDETITTISFANGTASFIASRKRPSPKRYMKLITDEGDKELNFLDKTISINKKRLNFSAITKNDISDPLLKNIQNFVLCIRDSDQIQNDNSDILAALNLAKKIELTREDFATDIAMIEGLTA